MNKEEILEYMIDKELIINFSWNGDNHYEIAESHQALSLAESIKEDMNELGETLEQYFKSGKIYDIAN